MQQLLVLLLPCWTVCHWWSAGTWRFSPARFWRIITPIDLAVYAVYDALLAVLNALDACVYANERAKVAGM